MRFLQGELPRGGNQATQGLQDEVVTRRNIATSMSRVEYRESRGKFDGHLDLATRERCSRGLKSEKINVSSLSTSSSSLLK